MAISNPTMITGHCLPRLKDRDWTHKSRTNGLRLPRSVIGVAIIRSSYRSRVAGVDTTFDGNGEIQVGIGTEPTKEQGIEVGNESKMLLQGNKSVRDTIAF